MRPSSERTRPRPAVGFLTWPPLPPLPPLCRSPPQDAVLVDHNHPPLIHNQATMPACDDNNYMDYPRRHHLIQDYQEDRRRGQQHLSNNLLALSNSNNQLPREYTSPDCELIVLQQSRIYDEHKRIHTPITANTSTMTRHTVMKSKRILNEPIQATQSRHNASRQFEYDIDHTITQHNADYFYDDIDHQQSQPSSYDNVTTDLMDLDSLMSCDITSLDEYIHGDSIADNQSTQILPSISSQQSDTSPPLSCTSSQLSTPVDVDPVDEFFPQLQHTSKIIRKPSSTASSSDYSDYRQKRDKNNVSSQKSRAKRQAKVQEIKEVKERLERRKVELTAMVSTLESQVEDYKRMVMMFINK